MSEEKGDIATRKAHKDFYDDLTSLLGRHAAHLPADELLALASNVVGKILAFQDQRTMTAEGAMALIRENIEIRNREAIAGLMKSQGSA